MPSTIRRPITLANLVKWGKAHSSMSASDARIAVGDVWMDSRKVQPGDVFVALRSESDDGHNYVEKALAAGASAAIVARAQVGRYPQQIHSRLIAAADPLRAVGRMACAYRLRLNIPFVAVTGSNGKTTTRQFIATVLGTRFTVGQTSGNWNNHIGVPLTVLRFTGRERIGVVELAANHKKEIGPLAAIVQPDIAVITNIGYAHIGLFGSLSETAKAKFEIVSGLRHRSNLVVLNGDDMRLVRYAQKMKHRVVFYGLSKRCGVRACDISVSPSGETSFVVDGFRYALGMPGRHFVYSALPAVFLGRWFGISESTIAEALRALEADPMRGRIENKGGVRFVIDCYNANPSSMRSGIALLCDVASGGRKVAIVGDMLELGPFSARLHRQLGTRLGVARVDVVIAAGQFGAHVADGARRSGIRARDIHCVPDAAAALETAKRVLRRGDTVLLKASRAVQLERVFDGF